MNNDRMINKIYDFGCVYSEYYKGEKDDEELAKVTTQPFWQSMSLSKKRLSKRNLELDISVKNENQHLIRMINHLEDDRNESASFNQDVIVDKSIKKNGKIIFHKKDKEMCISSAIKVHGEGNIYACPSCGHMGDISSYINGCDFCNAKFKVEDFDEKISSYSMCVDGRRRIGSICKKCGIIAGAAALIMIIGIVLAFIGVVVSDLGNLSDKVNSDASIMLYMLYITIPVFIKMFIVLMIVFGCITIFVYLSQRNELIIKNDTYYLLKKSIKGFIPEKFAQNLEYKLRNIHFAEKAEEVSSFASVNLNGVINNYQDVVECSMHKIKFVQYGRNNGNHYLSVQVILKLSRLRGEKIHEESEKVYIFLEEKESVEEKNFENIRMFPCKNCGSSVNILNGGVCDYCGTKMDYSEYDWIINRYYSNISVKEMDTINEPVFCGRKSFVEPYKKLRIQMIIAYISALLIVGMIVYAKNSDKIQLFANRGKYVELVEQEYGKIPLFSDMDSDVSLISTKKDMFSWKFVYSYDGFSSIIKEYADKLMYEYSFEVNKNKDNEMEFAKYTKYDKYAEGYIVVNIKYDTEKITVSYKMDDMDMNE